MTKPLRLTPRQRRQARLSFLLGEPIEDLAARLNREPASLKRSLQRLGLMRPEEPLEIERLSLAEARDQLAERLLGASLPAEELMKLSAHLTKLAGELRDLAKARTAAAPSSVDPMLALEEQVLAELDANWLGAVEPPLETKSARGARRPAGVARRAQAVRAHTVSTHRTGRANAAGGPMADMVVHGRTRRWQDKGGG